MLSVFVNIKKATHTASFFVSMVTMQFLILFFLSKQTICLIARYRIMSAFWAIVILPVFLASIPGNFSIIKYLKEKPLGRQTILDIVYKDFFTCNLIAIVVHGICICYVNTGDLLLPYWFEKIYFLTFPACFSIPIIFSNLNSNCSNLLDLRNLQEQVKKAFCYQKLFWPFTARINCSNDLKIFANSRPSASNFKSFSRSLEQFIQTVKVQNNFW